MEERAVIWTPIPMTGNDPIVTAPVDAYAPVETVFTINVKNRGGASGVFRARLVGVMSDGSSSDTNLPGFGANPTISADFELEKGKSVNVSFAYEKGTDVFDEYPLLTYIEENQSGTYVVRKISSTQLHFK